MDFICFWFSPPASLKHAEQIKYLFSVERTENKLLQSCGQNQGHIFKSIFRSPSHNCI
jgi:hypothetical protein